MGKKTIRQPVSRGVAKVPVIMQLENLECGAAALAMVIAYYDKWVPLEQVRIDCGVSRDGSNARNIYLAAKGYGLDVDAYRMSPLDLKENGTFPCIIHWNMNHFVVLDGFKGKYVYLNDPARGTVKVSWEEFDQSFTGVVLMMQPSDRFVLDGKPKSTLGFAGKRLTGSGTAVVFVMLTTGIAYLFGIANSATSRIFMDRILSGSNQNWLHPFIQFMIFLAVLQVLVEWIRAVYSLKINGKMAVVGSTTYMWKVLHLPMEFFSQRLAGDIQSRLELGIKDIGFMSKTENINSIMKPEGSKGIMAGLPRLTSPLPVRSYFPYMNGTSSFAAFLRGQQKILKIHFWLEIPVHGCIFITDQGIRPSVRNTTLPPRNNRWLLRNSVNH